VGDVGRNNPGLRADKGRAAHAWPSVDTVKGFAHATAPGSRPGDTKWQRLRRHGSLVV